MSIFSKHIDKRIAAYQRELIETHYQEVETMYKQIRGWRHDYRNHIQLMKVLAANGDTKAAGVKRIPIHSIRHSHISLLIDLGFSAVAIANRVGHESIDITYNYAHMFPSTQLDMANKLNEERGEDNG